jgi:AraC-like DNA-binding protein
VSIRTGKVIKAPQGLTNAPFKKGSLKINEFSVIQFCYNTQSRTGTLFLKEHLLLFVLKGVYTVRFGNQTYTVRSNQMVLLQKSIVIEYEKSGEAESGYELDYLMFFLKDELLDEFVKFADLKPTHSPSPVPVAVNSVNERITGYIESLEPYFEKPDEIGGGLVKVKTLELLFHIAEANEQFLLQFLQTKQKERTDIVNVMEENLLNPVSLSDLAYLSGRSLSTFKREFQAVYNTSPLQWIRNRRLDRAKELLTHSALSVTDVCFSTGFENIAHFSKVFKERFGFPPSELKQQHKLTESV